MLPAEQPRFFEVVTHALAAYGKSPATADLESWWRECRPLTIDALEVAFKSHRDDQERGERAPRPADITRRMKAGTADARLCAAADHTGRCGYPGLFSDGTAGEGSWYCPWHRVDRSGPEASRWIEVSRTTPFEVAQAKRVARMTAEGQRTASVVNTAHAIAKRHGSRPWQGNLSTFIPVEGE
jgi:hypothetical protein